MLTLPLIDAALPGVKLAPVVESYPVDVLVHGVVLRGEILTLQPAYFQAVPQALGQIVTAIRPIMAPVMTAAAALTSFMVPP